LTSEVISTHIITNCFPHIPSDYFTLQTKWLHENLCLIYEGIPNNGGCDGLDDLLLLSKVGLHMWDKMIQIEEQGAVLTKMIKMSQLVDVDEVNQSGDEEETTRLQSPHSNFIDKVGSIEKVIKVELQEIKEKMDSELQLKEKMDSEMQQMKGEVEKMGSEMRDMKDMMSKMMGLLAQTK
jgi:hypothetical protein